MAIISGGGTSGPRSQRFSKCRFQIPKTICLVQHMADKGPLWEEMIAKYKLRRFAYTDLVAWPFADYVFGTDWDVMSDGTKARLYGFHDVVDSQAMFVHLLRRFREERIVP
jgi:hypothetical protein